MVTSEMFDEELNVEFVNLCILESITDLTVVAVNVDVVVVSIGVVVNIVVISVGFSSSGVV